MLPNQEQIFSEIDYISPEEEGVTSLFSSEEEAVFALYEQLFCSLNHSSPETILNSMKYLIFSKSMTPQMEEIEHMQPCDVDVVHHRQVEKEVAEATQEIKKTLYQILEDKLF